MILLIEITTQVKKSLKMNRLCFDRKSFATLYSLEEKGISITRTKEVIMEKIANLKDIRKGESLSFNHKDEKAILIRTKEDDLVAYVAVCPHEGGSIEWDDRINMVLCECHLSLFNVKDGSIYRHSSFFELDKGLTRIDVSVDKAKNIFAL